MADEEKQEAKPIEVELPDADDLEGICIECHSSQPEQYMIRLMKMDWYGVSESPYSCKYCGGVVKIASRSQRDRFLRVEDRKRGL